MSLLRHDITAAYCGFCGLRPTLHRLPYAKARNTLLGLEAVGSALGPMSKSISGIASLTKAVIDSSPWLLDFKTPEIPWRQEMYELRHLKDINGESRRPVFGVMRWDKYCKPWPPLLRAIDIAVEAVRSAGYEGEHWL